MSFTSGVQCTDLPHDTDYRWRAGKCVVLKTAASGSMELDAAKWLVLLNSRC